MWLLPSIENLAVRWLLPLSHTLIISIPLVFYFFFCTRCTAVLMCAWDGLVCAVGGCFGFRVFLRVFWPLTLSSLVWLGLFAHCAIYPLFYSFPQWILADRALARGMRIGVVTAMTIGW
jgi:hypothetical protein